MTILSQPMTHKVLKKRHVHVHAVIPSWSDLGSKMICSPLHITSPASISVSEDRAPRRKFKKKPYWRYMYQDPVLWAWLEFFHIFFRLNTLKATAKAPPTPPPPCPFHTRILPGSVHSLSCYVNCTIITTLQTNRL